MKYATVAENQNQGGGSKEERNVICREERMDF